MHKAESVLEKESNKIQRDFEVRTDHLILIRSSDQVLINDERKEKENNSREVGVSMDHRVKIIESETINK